MPRPKPTEDDLKERTRRSSEIKKFMEDFKFTEKQLQDATGVSRRTIQMIKAARVTPQNLTFKAIETLYQQYRKTG